MIKLNYHKMDLQGYFLMNRESVKSYAENMSKEGLAICVSIVCIFIIVLVFGQLYYDYIKSESMKAIYIKKKIDTKEMELVVIDQDCVLYNCKDKKTWEKLEYGKEYYIGYKKHDVKTFNTINKVSDAPSYQQ